MQDLLENLKVKGIVLDKMSDSGEFVCFHVSEPKDYPVYMIANKFVTLLDVHGYKKCVAAGRENYPDDSYYTWTIWVQKT